MLIAAKSKSYLFLHSILPLARVFLAALTTIFLLKIIKPGLETDVYYAAGASSGISITVLDSLVRPSLIERIASYSADEFNLQKTINESLLIVLFYALPSFLLSFIITPLFSNGSDAEKNLFFLIYIFLIPIGIVNAIYGYLNYYLRLHDKTMLADISGLALQFSTYVFPLLIAKFAGILGFSIASSISTVLFATILLKFLGFAPVLPSLATLKAIYKNLKYSLGPSCVSKLFPLIESYCLFYVGNGVLTLYTFLRSGYSSVTSFVDFVYTSKVLAACQRFIGTDQKDCLLSEFRRYIYKIKLILLALIPFVCLGMIALPKLLEYIGVIKNAQGTLVILLLIALYPFAAGSILSSLATPLLYSLKQHQFVSKISVLSALAFALIILTSSRLFDLLGIATTISFYYLTNSLIFTFYLLRSRMSFQPASLSKL